MGELGPRDLTRAVFVGRQAELKLLLAGLDRVFERTGGMFLLSGEPGIGKTCLAEALTFEARRRGAAVFSGRSTQAEGAPPYWPWVQILRSLIRDLGEEEFGALAGPRLAQILQVVPELRGHFPNARQASAEDDQARFHIYDSVTQVLLDAATKRPVVLVLDDMHWADAPTLLLLKLLAGSFAQSSVMVIVTYRDRELPADNPLRAQLADFVRAGQTTEIAVSGLSHADVVALFRALTGFDLDASMVHRLHSQTAGNPFFLSELAKAFATEDLDSTRWKASTSADSVPRGVDAVLRRSVEGLSDDCRRMLDIAAVAGQELQLDLLEAATGTVRARILGLFDEAITKGVAIRADGGYAFAHGLVRDTVYRSLPTARRSKLHARIGHVLEELTKGSKDPPVAQLAYHFVEASVLDRSLRLKALDYASAAARRALSELAYEEAARILELALAKVALVEVAERAPLLLELGRARYLAGDIGGAMASAAEVSHLAEKSNDGDLLARAALVVRGVGGPGLSLEIKRLCTIAMRQPTLDTALRIQVLSQLTVALMQTGDAADERAAKEASQEAVRLAQNAIDPDVVFAGIHARQMATSGPDGVDERLLLADQTLRLAQETGRSSIAQWGHAWRIDALIQLGQIDQAEIAVAVQASHADELREPLARWRTLQVRSWLALLRGRFAEAGQLAEAARELGRQGHHAPAEFTYLTHLLGKATFVGGMEAPYQEMGRYMGMAAGLGPEAAAFAAGPLALMGRLEDARLALRQVAAAGLDTIGPPMAWLPAMALLTEAISAVDETDLGTGVYARLLPYARLNVSAGGAGLYGSVSRHLGMLAATLERWDEAGEHYERGLEFERRIGAPPHVIRSQIAYAEMLLRRGRDSDLRRARQLLDAAIASSKELGMKPWLERATGLAADLQARGVSDHPLTGREMEIAALVAEGLSNRAIAARLHLSERTVESHIKNVCDKLGFNSRSQVAAWVAGRHASR
jgi:DNA-binding CsgD family transcriptional regulator